VQTHTSADPCRLDLGPNEHYYLARLPCRVVDLEGMAGKAIDSAKEMANDMMASDARDMPGNKVAMNPETGFTYDGGKDPTVCGTFGGGSCSMPLTTK
jgi:hypothetical protein